MCSYLLHYRLEVENSPEGWALHRGGPLVRQALPLLIPQHRKIPPQLLQAHAIRLVAAQDRLDDVGREAGQAQHAADVGAVAADGMGKPYLGFLFIRSATTSEYRWLFIACQAAFDRLRVDFWPRPLAEARETMVNWLIVVRNKGISVEQQAGHKE